MALTALKAKRIFFERDALDYSLGKKMFERLKAEGHEISFLKSHNRVTNIPGKTPRGASFQGKDTLVVGVPFYPPGEK